MNTLYNMELQCMYEWFIYFLHGNCVLTFLFGPTLTHPPIILFVLQCLSVLHPTFIFSFLGVKLLWSQLQIRSVPSFLYHFHSLPHFLVDTLHLKHCSASSDLLDLTVRPLLP